MEDLEFNQSTNLYKQKNTDPYKSNLDPPKEINNDLENKPSARESLNQKSLKLANCLLLNLQLKNPLHMRFLLIVIWKGVKVNLLPIFAIQLTSQSKNGKRKNPGIFLTLNL